jgi:Cu/Ag efflux protein CusF
MQGEVKAVDPVGKTAMIDAGKIDDWMDAMTMEYPVKPDSELAKLHTGDHIEATVVVNGGFYYVTDVKVAPKK